MLNQKEQMLTAEFYSEGIVVGESLFLGNSSMAKNWKFWHLQSDYGSNAANCGKGAESSGN
jgi:hypothetical protein